MDIYTPLATLVNQVQVLLEELVLMQEEVHTSLIISDGTCESEPIDFVFSGDVSILTIDGLLNNSEISEGVSCELGSTRRTNFN